MRILFLYAQIKKKNVRIIHQQIQCFREKFMFFESCTTFHCKNTRNLYKNAFFFLNKIILQFFSEHSFTDMPHTFLLNELISYTVIMERITYVDNNN